MRIRNSSIIVPLLFAFSTLPLFAASSVTFEIIAVIDYPGAVFTSASGIDDHGDVAGIYNNDSGIEHGFVRLSNGHFSGPIIDPSDPVKFTEITGMNNRKMFCGLYSSGSFLLSGGLFTDLTAGTHSTTVLGLNDTGDFCGYTSGPDSSFVNWRDNDVISGSAFVLWRSARH